MSQKMKYDIHSLEMNLLSLEISFFDDFTFEYSSLARDFFRNGDLGHKLGISNIRLCITKNVDIGHFNKDTNTLCLNPAYVQDKCVLLHEMIHAYEHIFLETIPALREILTLHLYKKLSAAYTDLDVYLNHFLNRETFKEIARSGGIHGTLFALKALDIDLRMGWNPGTTFGYIAFD